MTEISPHAVRVLKVFQDNPQTWFENNEVAERSSVYARTVRKHTKELVELGILNEQRVFPATKYRLITEPVEDARSHLERYETARTVLGL
jgi:DNA-binding IclR family transcriptional regulator